MIDSPEPSLLYRAYGYASWDTGGRMTGYVTFDTFPVRRRTPKGVWITDHIYRDRFVLLSGVKRYAYPTKEEALESFRRRKQRELLLLKNRIERVSFQLERADDLEAGRTAPARNFSLSEMLKW